MSSTTSNAKAATLARMQAAISGLQKHLPNGQFTFGGVATTTASIVQLFQSLIAAMSAVTAAQASATEAVAAMRAAAAKVGPVYLALKNSLLGTYGNATSTLADFGLEPHKAPAPRTAAQKAAAAAKAKATRQARGTTSKKQKLTVTGNVSGIIVTPVTTTTAPSPAQPAPVASSAPTTGTPTK
jgi:hypothetical protein